MDSEPHEITPYHQRHSMRGRCGISFRRRGKRNRPLQSWGSRARFVSYQVIPTKSNPLISGLGHFSSPAPMTVLHELRHKRPDLVTQREVWIDGGVTRGTDVLKALCLGAKGVGLGRAFLYGNGAWGEDGVRRVVESELINCQRSERLISGFKVMRGEIETGMQLLGVTKIEDLRPELVRYVDRDLPPISPSLPASLSSSPSQRS